MIIRIFKTYFSLNEFKYLIRLFVGINGEAFMVQLRKIDNRCIITMSRGETRP